MKTKVREKANWPVTILLILGLITVVFPLYMTIVIAFKQPTEMTNSVAGILSLPEKFSLANFREAMEVTDFWHSLGNSVLITVITVVLAIVIHSLLGYAIARNKRSKFYKFIYLYVVSGMFVPFAILMMPLVKQTAEMGDVYKRQRQNSPFMAAANPFVFGSFTLYEGRTSYNLNQVSVQHHFVELATRQPGVYYGYYFLELADYFGKEGTDEKEMMNLLYVTIKAILNPHIEDRLVRCIYELRTMVIQGVMPQLFQCAGCGRELTEEETGELYFSQDEHGILCADCSRMVMDRKRISAAALYAMRYIAVSPLAKLYTFTVRDDVLRELERHIYRYTELNTDKRFKSLEILELMR